MSDKVSHLKYYKEHGISPVSYRMRTLDDHFDRRDAVYRSVGLPQAAFHGCRVLEVAPGSGQNSLYIAQARPLRYDLVEANPTAIKEIKGLYSGHDTTITKPTLHEIQFEMFPATASYDIVVCENWLGSQPEERTLIRKLASMVVPGGVMVITIVPYSGFLPNVMRRLLGLRVAGGTLAFDKQTELLVDAFGSHLGTIPNMTRSAEHWVQDCMLNPHYLNVALPFESVVNEIGDDMEALGTCPRFVTDWRWFKGLVGENRRFNEVFQNEYLANLHNFIDYRISLPPRSAAENMLIEAQARALHAAAVEYEGECASDGTLQSEKAAAIGRALEVFANSVAIGNPNLAPAISELAAIWARPKLSCDDIRNAGPFASWFGRETIYVAFTRRR